MMKSDDMVKETACSCDKCKSMCMKQPCLGTPKDIVEILKAGYGHKLASSRWLVGYITGTTDKPIEMVQPLADETGRCSFLDDNGLCILHDLGLKPTEGKLSHHTDADRFTGDFKDTINYKVAMTWVDQNGNNDPVSLLIKAAINTEQ